MELLRNLFHDALLLETRRHFLRDSAAGLGALWLAATTGRTWGGESSTKRDMAQAMAPAPSGFAAKAKRVIYLHMAGSPSQLDLFDYKPELARIDGRDCPESFLKGKQFAFIQGVPKMLGPQYGFTQHGQSGAWISDRLPLFASVADEVCFIKSMYTDQFNHGPAQLLMHTGTQSPGWASAGAWATYGLGSDNQNLPGFIVLTSGGKNPDAGKSVWGSGFLPSVFQGVQCRSQGDPVLFLSNPPGVSRDLRRRTLDAIAQINQRTAEETGDPETLTRIARYELAFRMQADASDAFDIRQEPPVVHSLYGTEPGKESFANNCLLARRLAERGVRFIQLFDWGWDSHGASESEALNHGFKGKCENIDRAMMALILDLKMRGMLDETLIVWSGEFGRTPMRENRNGVEMKFVGRDHNPGAFTLWMAGGGVKAGFSHGETDELGYQAALGKVSVHDFHATLLHLLGFDHMRFSYPVAGVNMRLTNVTKPGSRVVREVLV
ncbi:MAG: DUF1501 domain-containing protein [Verrucomicrobia bacterium]|nr:DUF1501 domain-containing protein [Verrucomicrobiota bacterium]